MVRYLPSPTRGGGTALQPCGARPRGGNLVIRTWSSLCIAGGMLTSQKKGCGSFRVWRDSKGARWPAARGNKCTRSIRAHRAVVVAPSRPANYRRVRPAGPWSSRPQGGGVLWITAFASERCPFSV